MNLLEKIMLLIVVCIFAAAFIQLILLLRIVLRKPHNVVIPRYEIARQKIIKENAGKKNEEWVYVDKEGFIILNWRNLRQNELEQLHYIPKSEVYTFHLKLQTT